MWKWTCPKNPLMVYELHSWKRMNDSLTLHENGAKFLGREIPPCDEIHEYWDNGEPSMVPRCGFTYLRNDEPSSERR